MSNKSGVSDQVLSLPPGGGALEGTGGSFSTDQQTGSGRYTLPVDVPDGRKGAQPDLALEYRSGNGDGAFGLGWTCGAGAVSRKTKNGVPVYDETEDTFLLGGGEDLVRVGEDIDDGTRIVRYRPRIEGEFSRIAHHRSADTDHWTVKRTDGTRQTYGTPGRAGEDPAVVADPDDRSKVFRWQLTETVDPFGNRIVYDYERDDAGSGSGHGAGGGGDASPDGAGSGRRWDQLYLDRIRYVDYEDEHGRTQFLVSVDFEYEERPEAFSRFTSGFDIRTRRRCARIVVRTHADEDRPITSYKLTYRDERPDADAPANGASLLAAVQVVGHDEAGETQRMPPVEFDYADFDPEGRDFKALDGPIPRRSLAVPTLELADLTGDGLPDMVEIDETIRYWRNLGDGEFDEPRPMDESPAGLTLADPGVQLMDADGDGRTDLVTFDTPLSGYFPLDRDGGWAEASFQAFERLPSVNLDAPNVQMTDLDGDGVTDIVRTGEQFECFFQDPEEGWTETRTVTGGIDGLEQVDFSDPRLRLADCCGDGLQDIVWIDDGHVSYWPNLGHGEWGARVVMRSPPDLPRDHEAGRILLGDVDGDGLSDLLYVEDDRVTLWLNRCGNGWSEPSVIRGTPSVTAADAIRLVDIEGDGIGGLLYSGGGRPGSDEMYFLDFTEDRKPYLMTQTRNNLGARTRMEYEPSTTFSRRDEREGQPWKTSLPQPMWVVSRVESIDEISGGRLTTTYRYHHGYWDGAGREYRGFGMVEQRDAESFEEYVAREDGPTGPSTGDGPAGSGDGTGPGGFGDREGSATVLDRTQFAPPTLTKTWYHVGPVGPEHGGWRELDYADEFWDGDGELFDRSDATRRLLRELPRRDERDAIRSLRGRTVRTEVYGLDGSERADRPYSVTETRFGIREEAPPATGADRRRIFFPHERRSRETAWERGHDPRTRITLTGEYDPYGQPRDRIEIAPPRGWRPGDATEEYLVRRTRTRYATPGPDGRYIVDRVAAEGEYDLVPRADYTVEQLRREIDAGTFDSTLIGLTRHYYDGSAFDGLALGEVGDRGAKVRTEKLVLTDELLDDVYGSWSGFAGDDVPSYLTDRAPSLGPPYPAAFGNGLEPHAGYRVAEDLPSEARADIGYFRIERRVAYDFQRSGRDTDRGLLVVDRDPLGNDTTITAYDAYDLHPTEVVDSYGLVTTATYDYAAMKAEQVTDPNGNRTRNGYTPLGLVGSVAELGTEGEREGDTVAQPSKRFHYAYRAFERSDPNDPEPPYVHTVEREAHRWDVIERLNERRRERGEAELTDAGIEAEFPNDPAAPIPERPEVEQHPERFLQSRTYSDGFGRVVQTVSQAENRVYGDDDTFGGGVLPPDQSDPATEPVAVDAVDQGELRVRVSGWKTRDNKGNVVEAYEPFFRTLKDWEYLSRAEAAGSSSDTFGQRVETYYDALGRETRSVNPDGSESRIVRGTVPDGQLEDPDAALPTPWERYEYDATDNAGRTHPRSATDYDHRWNAPTSKRFDALDREVETVQRNRRPRESDVETTSVERTFDARGNVVSVTDQLGREAFRYAYDFADAEIASFGIDDGEERVVRDATGNVLERRDAKGAIELHRYDAVRRETHAWARDHDGEDEAVTLRRRILHGDAEDPARLPTADARDRNLLGRVHRRYDEAGRLRSGAYDFKGNRLRTQRRVLNDDAVRNQPVDWTPPSGDDPAAREDDLLASGGFRIEAAYDALNRRTRTRYPRAPDGDRRDLRREFTRSGRLRRVKLVVAPDTANERTETYVDEIGYDASGNRTLVAYGNDVMTRYVYDDRTNRLRRQLTQPYVAAGAGSYAPDTGATDVVLQDFGYEYDLVGNVLAIHDRTPGSGVTDEGRGADGLDREFEYDALDRLLSATGREADDVPVPRPWGDTGPATEAETRYGVPDVTRRNAPNHTTHYTESYEYDAAGNLVRMHHQGSGSWNRTFGMGRVAAGDWTGNGWATTPANNRATNVRDGQGLAQPTHDYDEAGNLLSERNKTFTWDHANRLRSFEEAAGSGDPSVEAAYAYDSEGQRVKKVVDKRDRTDVTVYVDGIFEYRRREFESDAAETRINATLHVMDEESRVALVRAGEPIAEGDPTPVIRYQHGDHLGSSTLVVDGDGDWVDYEEFTPFGSTAFGGYARKRYRYTGAERDEESGLDYHGARYYAPWLGRWTSADPAGRVDGPNLYAYVGNNPLTRVDPSGTQSRPSGSTVSGTGSSSDASTGKTTEHVFTHLSKTPSKAGPIQFFSHVGKSKSKLLVPGITVKQAYGIATASGGVKGKLKKAGKQQIVSPIDRAKRVGKPNLKSNSGVGGFGRLTLEGKSLNPSSWSLNLRVGVSFGKGSASTRIGLGSDKPFSVGLRSQWKPPGGGVNKVSGTATYTPTRNRLELKGTGNFAVGKASVSHQFQPFGGKFKLKADLGPASASFTQKGDPAGGSKSLLEAELSVPMLDNSKASTTLGNDSPGDLSGTWSLEQAPGLKSSSEGSSGGGSKSTGGGSGSGSGSSESGGTVSGSSATGSNETNQQVTKRSSSTEEATAQ